MMRCAALVLGLLAAVVSVGCRRVAAYDPALTDGPRLPDGVPPVLDLAAEQSTALDAARDLGVDQGFPADLSQDARSDLGAPDAKAIPDTLALDLPGFCGAMDINDDGAWDLLDLLQIQLCLGKTVLAFGCGKTDISGNGVIDSADLSGVRNNLPFCDPTFSFPCAGGMTLDQVYTKDTATCTGSTPKDQCSAEATFCAAGWTMCTATAFKVRHGNKPAKTQAWIKGCVRDGAAAFAPADGLCGQGCVGTAAGLVSVAWRCINGAYNQINPASIGLTSFSDCYRVGVDDPNNAAMWVAQAAKQQYSGAVCCR